MDNRISQFLSKHRISVLSVVQTNGSAHAATCHFAHINDPFQIVFFTEDTSRKCQTLVKSNSVPATVTVGFSEEEWIEFQSSGQVTLLRSGPQFDSAKQAFESKFKTTLKIDAKDVFLTFTPSWYRYTEFKAQPKVVIENE